MPMPAPITGKVQLARIRSSPEGEGARTGSRVKKARPVLSSVLRPLKEISFAIFPPLRPRCSERLARTPGTLPRVAFYAEMTRFASIADLRAACLDLPGGDAAKAAAVAGRESLLTKPPRSLGRLEEVVEWLGLWQGKNPPRLDKVAILVFAGNHGVTAQGVSAYPAEVTAQMVQNFAAGGAAINQLARIAGAELRVIALDLDRPTEDFTLAPAMDEAEFLAAVSSGYGAVAPRSEERRVGKE